MVIYGSWWKESGQWWRPLLWGFFWDIEELSIDLWLELYSPQLRLRTPLFNSRAQQEESTRCFHTLWLDQEEQVSLKRIHEQSGKGGIVIWMNRFTMVTWLLLNQGSLAWETRRGNFNMILDCVCTNLYKFLALILLFRHERVSMILEDNHDPNISVAMLFMEQPRLHRVC